MAPRKPKAVVPVAAAEYCGNCRFYLEEEAACRHGPGQVVFDGTDFYTALPQKEPAEWCGQHQMKGPRQ